MIPTEQSSDSQNCAGGKGGEDTVCEKTKRQNEFLLRLENSCFVCRAECSREDYILDAYMMPNIGLLILEEAMKQSD